MRWSRRKDSEDLAAAEEDKISPATIVLTGSTGNLGCYILDVLLRNPRVEAVHCLNRGADAAARQLGLLAQRGLQKDQKNLADDPRIHFHQCDLAEPRLGLSPASADAIAATATHYLHCAWPVDWNQSYSSFEPAVRGVSGLVSFVLEAKTNAKLFFISSVAAAGNWGAIPGAHLDVPEEELDDWKVARFGYGQSKLVSERLMGHASRTSGLTGAVCRIGQVGGPVDHGEEGSWPAQEWLPSLLLSSRYLNTVPADLGPMDDVDWVPVDRLADIVTELLLSKQDDGSMAFHHVVNPVRKPWKEVMSVVKEKLPSAEPVNIDKWTLRLEQSAEEMADASDVGDNPAVKLLPVFLDVADKAVHLPKARAATLSLKHTIKRSPTLARLEPVNDTWMSLWLKQLSL
ncbi:putative secondary metabolism biosynthetic enzyme [Lecanicillium sp. MT-2017a]|nr:putative secondary metabolism biosynthetic enzyme [Lecanicillium sp. MT-2017a]